MMSMLFLAVHPSVKADECSAYCDEWSVGSGKFKVGADWLYWQVSEDNFEAASILRWDGDDEHPKHFRPVGSNPKWNSGYRVNLGYEFCDCWDLEAIYTNLPNRNRSRHHSLESSDADNYIVLSDQFDFEDFIIPGYFRSFQTRSHNDLSWIDLDMSRAVCFGECFTVRPHVGFRALWIENKFKMHGEFPDVSSGANLEPNNPFFFAHLKHELTGYGVEGGLWTNWELGCGLSVVGHFGGSILYTRHRIHQHAADSFLVIPTGAVTRTETTEGEVEGTTQEESIVAVNPVSGSHTQFFGVPTMDYFLGLQYESTFCDFILIGRVGWEQHIFFDVNRLSRHRGNLSAQGLTLGLEAAF
jgi:hypothetical protein